MAVKHPHGESDFAGGVAFVEVHAALHCRHRNACYIADHHLSGVADGGRARKKRNVGVWNLSCVREFVGESAEAGAEDESDLWAHGSLGHQELRGRSGFAEVVIHFRGLSGRCSAGFFRPFRAASRPFLYPGLAP